MRRLTKEEFINRAIAIHGDKYDYSKTVYVNSRTKVCIICNKCGCEFWQKPSFHITRGDGCPMCNPHHKMNTDEFIQKAVKKHGDKYDYSLVEYLGAETKVKIICSKHGVFEQTPAAHIAGQGCPECKNEITSKIHSKTQEEFLRQAIMTHGDKYNYSNVVYKGSQIKVCIKCNICGKEFWQTPDNHVHQKHGCTWCSGKKKTTESFIEELKAIYKDSFNYDSVVYVNSFTPVKLFCKKHGYFEKNPAKLLCGYGCPQCIIISKGEIKVSNFLNENKIKYEKEKLIPNDNLLAVNKHFRVDFYLPEHNIIIEYNGKQHYKPVDKFGGDKQLELQQERDYALRQYCKEHKIKLIEIPYTEYNNIEDKLTKELGLGGRGFRK